MESFSLFERVVDDRGPSTHKPTLGCWCGILGVGSVFKLASSATRVETLPWHFDSIFEASVSVFFLSPRSAAQL